MTLLGGLLLAWLAYLVGFVVGCYWGTTRTERKAEERERTGRQVNLATPDHFVRVFVWPN